MPLVFNEDDLEAMGRLRKAFIGDLPDSKPIDVPSLEERFNPGKVFPGGAVHGEAYGITDKSFRPRAHKTGSKNERINKSRTRFFARLSVSNINLYVRLSEKLRSVLRELVLRWNEGSRSGQHRLFFNCQTTLDHSDN
ncbi:MAG: hypothetical protein CM1200mP39_26610 [Dehalococcoidia bacterium]|nr:MAG: hypothetical protein CM1200mP39_26610 [Dehalococcoidia bacterium]